MLSWKLPASSLAWLLSTACMLLLGSTAVHAADRALLVGVGKYPLLPGKQLAGPANDLRLMTSTLARLGWPASQVQVLSDAAGPAQWPTRAHILAALAQLAAQAQPGDWVVVYFSGHGSQVPQMVTTRAKFREPDGLDEVFLPMDTSAWDPAQRIVVGAITDDEMNAALARITNKGAQVWAIFDTCHAGDMLRGAPIASGDEPPVWRYVSPLDLKVPVEELSRSFGQASRRPGRAQPPLPVVAERAASSAGQRWVGFFASQADEGAAEESLPDPEQPQRKQRFGVFTHLIHQAAAQWRGSFAELAARLQQGYRDRPFPTPEFQGHLSAVPRFAAAAADSALTPQPR